jgi:hypothetical protein
MQKEKNDLKQKEAAREQQHGERQAAQERSLEAKREEADRYVQTEHLYNIQCSEIFTLRNEKLHTEV